MYVNDRFQVDGCVSGFGNVSVFTLDSAKEESIGSHASLVSFVSNILALFLRHCNSVWATYVV